MKKKWLVCLLSVVCLTASAFAFASCGEEEVSGSSSGNPTQTLPNSSQEPTQGLSFGKIDGKEEYAVVGLGTVKGSQIVIPSTYNDLPVTTIGGSAFEDCDRLTSVVIPDSVTTIGDYAFYDCYNLTSVVIPDSVTTIGDYAFSGCESLTSVVIPDSVTTIGDDAFSDCYDLTSVVIPDSVTTIGEGAFSGCSSLTSVVIPDSVTTIENYAFFSCNSLTSVVIPDSVTTIGDDAFAYCRSLTIYCEAESKPDGWDSDWNYSNRPVVWGYKD